MLQCWQVSSSHAFLQPLDQSGIQIPLKHHFKSSEHFQGNKNHSVCGSYMAWWVSDLPRSDEALSQPLVTAFFIHPLCPIRREQQGFFRNNKSGSVPDWSGDLLHEVKWMEKLFWTSPSSSLTPMLECWDAENPGIQVHREQEPAVPQVPRSSGSSFPLHFFTWNQLYPLTSQEEGVGAWGAPS